MGDSGRPTRPSQQEIAGVRAEALEALSDAFAWKLADARWQEIRRILDSMAAALKAGDVNALAEATAHLELAGPLRIIPIGAATGPPPPVHDLLNVLVHALGGVTVDGPSAEPGDTGAASAGVPRG
jgi:hypothetical protein